MNGAQNRATKVASSVSTGMCLEKRNKENEDHSQKRWRGFDKHTNSYL
jgi:hypothetical protein